MEQEEKDLCKTCEHYWLDFPLPLDHYVPHCEVIDENRITDYVLDDIVPYPCLECPFGCYSKKKYIMNISEDYCSFEVAKLLKDKGFDEYCVGAYSETNHSIIPFNERVKNSELGLLMYVSPTHQMARKWLREVHNIDVEIRRSPNTMMYRCIIYKDTLVKCITDAIMETYEQAVESAIKYCLENLI